MLLNLVGAIDRTRFEPVFLAIGQGSLVDEMRALGVEVVSGSADICSLRNPVDLAKRALAAARFLKALRISVVHVNTWPWNLDMAFGAWLKRIPVVVHTHNFTTVHRANLTRFVADKVLFVSEYHRQATQRLALIRKKSEVLHNFIDFAHYGSGRDIRRELGLTPHDFVVVTVAQISAHKGIQTVVDTARICVAANARMRFLIVGGDNADERAYAREVRRSVEISGLSSHVRFTGPRSDVPDILASADVLFHPTLRESFGLVIVEAMAAGKPVVASTAGGIPEIMGAVGGGGVLVSDPTAEAFASALMQFCEAPERCRAVGADGRLRARQHFSREAVVPKLEQIYDELLGVAPKGHRV
jgi:glycosyltransferase involved in cell wall biosynthesis